MSLAGEEVGAARRGRRSLEVAVPLVCLVERAVRA